MKRAKQTEQPPLTQCDTFCLRKTGEVSWYCSLVLLDLEWKIIYVGSAESEEYDQTLDSVLVGPVPAGRHMFVFQVSDTDHQPALHIHRGLFFTIRYFLFCKLGH